MAHAAECRRHSAGMATLIVASSTAMCILYAIVTRVLLNRTQAWRTAARV